MRKRQPTNVSGSFRRLAYPRIALRDRTVAQYTFCSNLGFRRPPSESRRLDAGKQADSKRSHAMDIKTALSRGELERRASLEKECARLWQEYCAVSAELDGIRRQQADAFHRLIGESLPACGDDPEVV
jgi:hypothetical protein